MGWGGSAFAALGGGSCSAVKWGRSAGSGLVGACPGKRELLGSGGRGVRKGVVAEAVRVGELGKEARTWAENQVMHIKKTRALLRERAFYRGNKTRFFLRMEYSSLFKLCFTGCSSG